MTDASPGRWHKLGAVPPAGLVDARLQLHHAAQLVTAAGRSLLPPRPDDSHTAFEWLEHSGLLAGGWIEGKNHWRAALRPADCTLVLLDKAGAEMAEYPMAGRTLEQGFAWLREQAGARGSDARRLCREAPHEIPPHAAGAGRPLAPDERACAELARYWANAARLFAPIVANRPEASAVRCWPHHFDLGFILGLAPDAAGRARSIGVGLSPGDASYAEPYFYVTPFPVPDCALPGPPLGHWHREGWTGLVLTAAELHDGTGDPAARAGAFLEAALKLSRQLLGA